MVCQTYKSLILLRWIKGYIEELGKDGYPIPKESNKNVYTQACWVLQWLNKDEPSEGNELVKKAIKNMLPVLKRVTDKLSKQSLNVQLTIPK